MAVPLRSESAPVVLVVDDEPLVCYMASRMLSDAGFLVVEAHDGTHALEVLTTAQVAVVLSDISMPGMSGLGLRDRIAERWPEVQVLLMSGQGGPPTGHPGPFLPKPFCTDALLAAVQAMLPRQAAPS